MTNFQGAIFKYSKSTSNTSILVSGLYYPTTLTVDWISRVLIYFEMSGDLTICTLNGMNCSAVLRIGHKNVRTLRVDARFG